MSFQCCLYKLIFQGFVSTFLFSFLFLFFLTSLYLLSLFSFYLFCLCTIIKDIPVSIYFLPKWSPKPHRWPSCHGTIYLETLLIGLCLQQLTEFMNNSLVLSCFKLHKRMIFICHSQAECISKKFYLILYSLRSWRRNAINIWQRVTFNSSVTENVI